MERARTQRMIHGEQILDNNRHMRLSTVDVELPDGTAFTQYVARMPRCAMTLVLHDDERVLLMWRHRFIIDRWVWELPGGYVDDAENVAAAAAREVEEETPVGGHARWSTSSPSNRLSVRLTDRNGLSRARPRPHRCCSGRERGRRVASFDLGEAATMIERGEIVCAATVVGVYRALTLASRPRPVGELGNLRHVRVVLQPTV